MKPLLVHADSVLHGVDHAAAGAARFVCVLGATSLVGHALAGRLGAVRLTLTVPIIVSELGQNGIDMMENA